MHDAASRTALAPLAALIFTTALFGIAAEPAAAWTPKSQVSIAESAAQLAPPDLRRQIAKNRGKFREGIEAPFRDDDAGRHMKNSDGSGSLDRVLLYEIDGVIKSIQAHRSFEEVVYRLGIVAHYLADANNPLNCESKDRREGTYFRDYLRYMESAEPRFQPVFYGLRPEVQRASSLAPMLGETFDRCRRFYPVIGREYQRVGKIDGRRTFDDRSSAFAIAALSYSHAISDVAEAFRYVWIQAGGGDPRKRLPIRGKQVVPVPRAADLSAHAAEDPGKTPTTGKRIGGGSSKPSQRPSRRPTVVTIDPKR